MKTFERTELEAEKGQMQYVRDTFGNWISMNFGMKVNDLLAKLEHLVPVSFVLLSNVL